MYTHISHHMQIVHDVTGWDYDYDKMVDLVESYDDFGYTEVKTYIDRITNEEE
ncbi:hypothetical protein SMUDGE_204 [Bacillus phage Smudge]|uniref:Uncharacterized protein n=1 Tax=Bacillus phage Smudge TaxID=1852566 RepID=A0A173H2U7_9CAUD|nr:hypothetical protein SMUDGE_204 [Bacillus phage Smudge]